MWNSVGEDAKQVKNLLSYNKQSCSLLLLQWYKIYSLTKYLDVFDCMLTVAFM